MALYAWYRTYIDEAYGRDPLRNDAVLESWETILQHSPPQYDGQDAWKWLADAYKARDNRDKAEKYMRELIAWRVANGSRSFGAVADISRLQSWLLEWGEYEKAADLTLWRNKVLDDVEVIRGRVWTAH